MAIREKNDDLRITKSVWHNKNTKFHVSMTIFIALLVPRSESIAGLGDDSIISIDFQKIR